MIVGAGVELTGAGVDSTQTSSTGVMAMANRAGQHMYQFLFTDRYPPLPAGSVFNVEDEEWIAPSVCVDPPVSQEEVVQIVSSSDSGSMGNRT